MNSKKPSKKEFIPSEPCIPVLDVPKMTEPILNNYDTHVNIFIRFLRDRLRCHLVYQGPHDVHQHILQRTTYACSVHWRPKKILKDVFPIMIGSRLDLAIRHRHQCSFTKELSPETTAPLFQDLDIGCGFFIINGFLRQVPYFYTNDSTNTHVIKKKIVRVYTYDKYDRGKELSYHVVEGKTVVVQNNGSEMPEDPYFFHHCPYITKPAEYMHQVYKDNLFDIDHLGNKIVVSPGHLFVKLFVKYLYGPLRQDNWTLIKSKLNLVTKSIETGCLLHVLSRKTLYFKEGRSTGKMTRIPQESHREIGENGEIFIEKSMGCYREVNMQTYPLNPYLLYLIVRQMSKKVKHSSVPSFHPSYLGYFCILGCFETKNVGRTTMMVRNTVVSISDLLDPVFRDIDSAFWDFLQLEPKDPSRHFVVVNEACVSVSAASFERIQLLELKRKYIHIECYQRGQFIIIRYKTGLIMKCLPGTDIWVTPNDEMYWIQRYCGFSDKDRMIEQWGFPTITSYMVDLNPFFKHNAFPKNILAFNALKNAVLATTNRYALYFMDTMSAYFPKPTDYHQVVLPPANDGVSEHFALKIPRLLVAYASFLGCTQEDCIVQNAKLSSFDCCRFYSVRFKITYRGWIRFYPVTGDPDNTSDLLGVLVGDDDGMQVEPYSIHVRVDQKSPREFTFRFSKYPFKVVQHHITGDKLIVCVEQRHTSSTGDKLCSLHGQKGVIRVMESVPLLDEAVEPDLLINPYSLFRMTMGQILEGIHWGRGRDSTSVRNSEGIVVPSCKVFYARTFYFPIAYWSGEHLYAPRTCVLDRVLGMAVKGRSRGGGMRLGNMELMNVLRGNGIASCYEQKFCEDGDVMPISERSAVALPKSIHLVQEDAKFYKCNLRYEISPTVRIEKMI